MYNYGPGTPSGAPNPDNSSNGPYGNQPQYPDNGAVNQGGPMGPVVPQQYDTSPQMTSGPPDYASGAAAPMFPTAPVTGAGQLGPMMSPGAPPPTTSKNPAVPLLAAATALLFITTGVFLFLFIGKSGDLTDAKATIATRDSTITTNEEEITGLEDQIATAQTDITALEDQLALAEGDAQTREDLEACLSATYDFLTALGDGTSESKLTDLADDADSTCQSVWYLIQ